MNEGHRTFQFLPHTEGKIRSYHSCEDCAAWSHEPSKKDWFFREWIKSDMPICFIPARVLASFLKRMTGRNRGKVSSSCHSSCKSKVILESICASCQAMKECLKNEESCSKFFDEEDFETGHWPCDRCLEALKSIKMCWKIITDKVFHVKIHKDTYDMPQYSRSNSIRCIAANWKNEIIDQTSIINNIIKENKNQRTGKFANATSSRLSIRDKKNSGDSRFNYEIDSLSSHAPLYKVTRSISAKIKGIDVACDACDLESSEVKDLKQNMESLKDRLEKQQNEMDECKKENDALRNEMKAMICKNLTRKPSRCTSMQIKGSTYRLMPYGDPNPINVDSEMIITMKKCKNENYRRVSIINVMHKTNALSNESIDGPLAKKEDPIRLLTKVHNKFGAIVKREMKIAVEKKRFPNNYEVDAMYQRISEPKSAPSFTTISSCETPVTAREN